MPQESQPNDLIKTYLLVYMYVFIYIIYIYQISIEIYLDLRLYEHKL